MEWIRIEKGKEKQSHFIGNDVAAGWWVVVSFETMPEGKERSFVPLETTWQKVGGVKGESFHWKRPGHGPYVKQKQKIVKQKQKKSGHIKGVISLETTRWRVSRATRVSFHQKRRWMGQRPSRFIGNDMVEGGWGNNRVISLETIVRRGEVKTESFRWERCGRE